ncbi:MAG: ABC transporter substrate-binding protein [Candidatus Aminicenantes bacterium]|nr:MAG: ABC transporter substrate-binding protein [Candidatus Aminicenantes bacterium]
MSCKKIPLALFLILLCSISLIGQNKVIRDALDYPFVIKSAPQRIISLAPNITEILFVLGLGDRVIGVTRYCDYPKEAMEKEIIGGMVNPNLERILELNPDLVIGFRGNTLKALERMRNLDLPLFTLEMGAGLESIFPLIMRIGTITQVEEKADILIRSLRKKFSDTIIALLSVRHEPKVFLSLHGMGLWTCGKDSFLNDLVRKARGVNIAGNIPRKWLNYNKEQFLHENPEVIIILSKSLEEFSKTKERIKNESQFEEIKAISTGRIYFLDENPSTRPGPRLIDALGKLARLLHPQCFEQEL